MKLESLNSEKFAPMGISSMQQTIGGEVTTSGAATTTYQGREYDFAVDRYWRDDAGFHFEAEDKDGKCVLQYTAS